MKPNAELAAAEVALAGDGARVRAVRADLSTAEGVERLWSAVAADGRPWTPWPSTPGSG